jgi:hypothetical protein
MRRLWPREPAPGSAVQRAEHGPRLALGDHAITTFSMFMSGLFACGSTIIGVPEDISTVSGTPGRILPDASALGWVAISISEQCA